MSNVDSVSMLFVFVLCLVCAMLIVSLCCLSSFCVLYVHSYKTQDEDNQHRDTVNIGHTKHRTKTNNIETTNIFDNSKHQK
jgi:hypothetical protein